MKKILRSILALAILSIVIVALAGCSDFLSDILKDECEHTGGKATCTEMAICEKCNEPYGEPLGHTEVVLDAVPATCTASGKTEGKKCSVCGTVLVEQETVNVLGHDIQHHDSQAPTCTAKGWEAYDACSRCDYTTKVEIDALEHEYADVWSRGEYEHWHECSLCHDRTDVASHRPNIENATETESKVCIDCQYVIESPLGHTHVVTFNSEVPATCLVAGVKAHYACACGKTFSDEACTEELVSLVITALGHSLGEWQAEVPPTCTEAGTKGHYYCSACQKNFADDKKTEISDLTITALGHSLGEWKAEVPATCTEAGTKGHYYCSACQKNFADDKQTEISDLTITALGHSLGEWQAEVPATCTEAGTKAHYYCSVCQKNFADDKQTEISALTITALGHSLGEWQAEVPATCTEAGTKAHYYCSVCQKNFADDKKTEISDLTITALGHSLGEWQTEVPATCTEAGTKGHYYCSACQKNFADDKKTEISDLTITALGHNLGEWQTEVPATCTEAGTKGHYYCSACQKNFADDKKTEISDLTITALGHSLGEWQAEVPATCTEAGTKAHYYCSVCQKNFADDKKTEISDLTITALGHSLGEWQAEVPATCTEAGTKAHYYCSVCQKNFADDKKTEISDLTITALGHTYVQDTATSRHCSTCNEAWLTLNGTISAEHYDNLLSSLAVTAESGTDKYTGAVTGSNWSVEVPAELTDITVKLHDNAGRFNDIEILYGMADDNSAATVTLIPKMNKYDVWTNHNGVSVSDQSKLVLNADGSYSIIKTESGNALSNSEWWASGVATGATFAGVTSDHFVLETEIILHSAGGWNQWHAGITVDEKEFIMIMDRDWQLAAWTEWNLAEGSAGSWTDLITDEKAAAAGIVKDNSWGTEAKPMKVTVVRDGKDMYIFLNEVFIGKFAISSTLFPNSNRDGSSSYVGFMVKSGTEATFKNYWYELGEEKVDAYLAGKQATVPTFDVVDDEGQHIEGGSVQFYKEVLVSTDNANGYIETTEWQLATEADFVIGARLKAVFAPITLDAGECVFTGVKINGVSVSLVNGECVFTLGADDELVLSAMLNLPVDSVVTVSGVSLNGATIKFTNVEDSSEVLTPVVAENKFTLSNVWIGSKYNAVVEIAGTEVSLGTLEITDKSISWNPKSIMTSGTGSVDIGGNTYGIVGSEKGRVDFNVLSGSITAGDVFIVTKIQISAEDYQALLDAKGESIFGVELRADGRAVENMIRFYGGNIQLLSGDWTADDQFIVNGEPTDYANALKGDGLYFGVQYVASSGMTYTWLGTSLDTLTCIRDWGTGGATDPGYRSFDANSQITGFGLGYVHCWTGNDANLRADVTYSEVFVSKTIDGVKNSNVLLDMSEATLKWESTNNTFNGTPYQNSKGALSYSAELDAAQYTLTNIATATGRESGESFVPYIQGFNFTDISAYSTITFKVKIDETTCSEDLALTVRPFNKTAAATQKIVAGEWVELTFNISDFTHAWDTTVSGYLAAVDTSALTNLGFVFMVEDTDNMKITSGFTMYISDFIVK